MEDEDKRRKIRTMIAKRGGGAYNVSVKNEKVEEVKVMKYLYRGNVLLGGVM